MNVIAGIVIDRLGVHRFHDADVVGDGLDVRQEIADPSSMLAAAAAGPHRRDDGELRLAARHSGDALSAFDGGRQFLAVKSLERGFVVEEVDVGEAFALEEAENAFGFGGEVGERASRAVPGARGQRVNSGARTPRLAE